MKSAAKITRNLTLNKFKHLRHKVGVLLTFVEGEEREFALGYQRGLQRAYHGDLFGSEEEHQALLRQGDPDTCTPRGRGYRAGLAGKDIN